MSAKKRPVIKEEVLVEPTRLIEKPRQPDRVQQLKALQKESLALFTKKNADYGDAFAQFGLVGVLVRMEDKIKRSISIGQRGIHLVETETLRDTLVDLANYAAMAVLLIDNGELPSAVGSSESVGSSASAAPSLLGSSASAIGSLVEVSVQDDVSLIEPPTVVEEEEQRCRLM
jgi:hypothetical protein